MTKDEWLSVTYAGDRYWVKGHVAYGRSGTPETPPEPEELVIEDVKRSPNEPELSDAEVEKLVEDDGFMVSVADALFELRLDE